MDVYLPGLGEGVDFHGERTPPQLVDRKNHRVLELTALEAELVLLYAGERDPQQLAERAKAHGVTAEPSLVAAFLSRLAQAGFIPKLEVQHLLPAQGPLRLQDPLPPFRSDLKIRPSATSRGLVEVVDEEKHRSFTIYDFEASVARLLDGRRTADEVIETGAALGIPISLASLQSFLRQMGAYGFLGAGPMAGPREPTRQPWAPEVRALFQGALRLSRAGKTQEALDYLEALFETDPQNAEALALKQRLQGDPSFAVDLNFDDLHEQPGGGSSAGSSPNPPGTATPAVAPAPAAEVTPASATPPAAVAPPSARVEATSAAPTNDSSPPPVVEAAPAPGPPAAKPTPSSQATSVASAEGTLAPAESDSFLITSVPTFFPASAAPSAPAVASAEEPPPGDPVVAPRRTTERSRRPIVVEEANLEPVAIWRRLWFQVLVGSAVIALAVALWPSRFKVTVGCQLEPVVLAAVVAPREGDIAARLVGAGELARAGQPLARYQTQDLERELAKAGERSAAAELEIAQALEQVDPSAVAKLTHQLELRRSAVEKAAARETKLKAGRPSAHRDQKLEAAAHRSEVATHRLAEADAKLRTARGEERLAALRSELARVVAEQKRLQGEVAAAVILAPAAGLFLPAPDRDDAHFLANQDYGRIVSPDRLHLTATAPPEASSANLKAAVLVMPEGTSGVLHDLAWATGSRPGQLEGTVEGAAAAQGPVVGATVQLDLGLRINLWKALHE